MTGTTSQNCYTFHIQTLRGLFCALLCSTTILGGSSPTPAKKLAQQDMPPVDRVRAQFLPISGVAELAERKVDLEVARTFSEQAKGLMFRPALPDDRGMLFPFSPPRPISFWMKNVPVALDMVFIRQSRIVAIAQAVPPCTAEPCAVYPTQPVVVDSVLELRSGWAQAMGLRVGDRVIVTETATKN